MRGKGRGWWCATGCAREGEREGGGVRNALCGGRLDAGGEGCFSFGVQTSGEYISTMFGCI